MFENDELLKKINALEEQLKAFKFGSPESTVPPTYGNEVLETQIITLNTELNSKHIEIDKLKEELALSNEKLL